MPQGTDFSGGRELEKVIQDHPLLGNLLRRMGNAINRLGQNGVISPVGQLPPPPPVDSTDVAGSFDATANTLTVPGEILHAVHTHNAPLQRGIQYVTEIDTDPSFPNPHPLPNNTSRSVFATLPTFQTGGTDPVGYYMRVTPQYHGSEPGTPTVFGNLQGPTKILLSGTTKLTLLQSQAAGTARPGQGGKGLGPVPARGPVGGPKRNLST